MFGADAVASWAEIWVPRHGLRSEVRRRGLRSGVRLATAARAPEKAQHVRQAAPIGRQELRQGPPRSSKFCADLQSVEPQRSTKRGSLKAAQADHILFLGKLWCLMSSLLIKPGQFNAVGQQRQPQSARGPFPDCRGG
nr:hypothetical protein Iba_chr09cCG5170 [Ipomoea batatas]